MMFAKVAWKISVNHLCSLRLSGWWPATHEWLRCGLQALAATFPAAVQHGEGPEAHVLHAGPTWLGVGVHMP